MPDLGPMMSDPSRAAAVEAALVQVEPGMTISLGSGRAVFALTEAIGSRWPDGVPVRSLVASSETTRLAAAAGIPIVELRSGVKVDVAFDGADEVDDSLRLIKGGGAAMLREKLVMANARRVVIMAEAEKRSTRVGDKRKLPIAIVPFGWETTRDRVLSISSEIALRRADDDEPATTDEGHYILDVTIPLSVDINEFARSIKLTLGVVEHGLFLDEASEVILGNADGTIARLVRT